MIDERLDALYRERPGAFVAGRDRLAKDVRDAGDREEANRIKALRRPSVAAWLINAAALSSPELLEAFAEASHRLGEVQGRALEGRKDAMTEWRDAAGREREASRAVVERRAGARARRRRKGDPKGARIRRRHAAGGGRRCGAARPRHARKARARGVRAHTRASRGVPCPPRGHWFVEAPPGDLARREVERLRQELDDAAGREQRLRESVDGPPRRCVRRRRGSGQARTARLRRDVKAAERKAT